MSLDNLKAESEFLNHEISSSQSELFPATREKLINTAVEFLISPAVQNSSMNMKVSFLKKKGLNEAELGVAIKRAEERLTREHSVVIVGQQPPPSMQLVPYNPFALSPWLRFREFMNTVVILSGFAYGLYWVYKNIVIPYLFGKRKKKSIESRLDDLDVAVATCVSEINLSVSRISTSLESRDEKNESINKKIEELKTEVTSLKKLLLNRKQFPQTNFTAGPVSIPSWQKRKGDDKDTNEEEGNGSGTNGSDSSLEMIK